MRVKCNVKSRDWSIWTSTSFRPFGYHLQKISLSTYLHLCWILVPKVFFVAEISLSGFTKKSIFLAFAECLQVSLDLENIFGSFENFRLLHSLCKVVEWVLRWQGVSATWIYHLQGGHLSISPAPSALPSRWGKTNCVTPHICIFCFLQFKY